MSDPAQKQPSDALLRAEAGSALGTRGVRNGYMDALEGRPLPGTLTDEDQRAYDVGKAVFARVQHKWEIAPQWPAGTQAHKKILDAAVDMALTPAVFAGGEAAVRSLLEHARPLTYDDLNPPANATADYAPAPDPDATPDPGSGGDDPDGGYPSPDDFGGDAGDGLIKPLYAPGGSPKKLPPDFPLTPLGADKGMFYFLDRMKQIAAIQRGTLRRQTVAQYVLNGLYLAAHYPVYNAQEVWQPHKFNEDLCIQHMLLACEDRGLWSPLDAERGPGAWRDDEARLVIHLGDRLIIEGDDLAPGVIGRHIYSAAPALPAPSDVADADEGKAAAAELLETLSTWHWARGDLDARLFLGHIMAGLIGGAIKWRPVGWITGGAGTGKSTLHEMLQAMLGTAGLFSDETTAAGITSALGNKTVPVFLDEVEPDDDGRKEQQLIKTARIMASGGTKRRGSADHGGVQFTLRSTVLFSSIDIPPLDAQDRSRIVIYEVLPLSDGAALPDLSAERMQRLYAVLLRRLINEFGRYNRLFEQFRAELGRVGHSNRTADVFGTLLAASEVVLSDVDIMNRDALRAWGERLDASKLAETAEADSGELRCLSRLRTSVADPYRSGQRATIAELCAKWKRAFDDEAGEIGRQDRRVTDPPSQNRLDAETDLGSAGLKIIGFDEVKAAAHGDVQAPASGFWLAVANDHTGLAALFEGTRWKRGGWRQPLRRLPGAARTKSNVTIADVKTRASLVPLDLIFGDPEPRARATTTRGDDDPF